MVIKIIQCKRLLTLPYLFPKYPLGIVTVALISATGIPRKIAFWILPTDSSPCSVVLNAVKEVIERRWYFKKAISCFFLGSFCYLSGIIHASL